MYLQHPALSKEIAGKQKHQEARSEPLAIGAEPLPPPYSGCGWLAVTASPSGGSPCGSILHGAWLLGDARLTGEPRRGEIVPSCWNTQATVTASHSSPCHLPSIPTDWLSISMRRKRSRSVMEKHPAAFSNASTGSRPFSRTDTPTQHAWFHKPRIDHATMRVLPARPWRHVTACV